LHEEWSVSVHAQAWIDPQFQAEIGKSGNRWLCLNCHTPLLTQMDTWAVGLHDDDIERPVLVDNPVFDEALRDEGITCAACHVRGDAIVGPGLGGDAPHAVVADPTMGTGALCLRCHQAEAAWPDKSFVCTFQTGDEWRAGPYEDEGTTCVTCHMPRAERPVAVGGPERSVGRHWWRGAGIPKIEGRYPPPEANDYGLGLQVAVEGDELVVRYGNEHAGHRLPSGDPERWVQIDVAFDVGEPVSWRIQQVWAWETPPRKVSDDRLAPREWRSKRIAVPEGATTATIEASNHRISEENAAYHHLSDYPRHVVTHQLTVPLE
jgi:nitrate reductase cytochrome c-type subunit